MSKRIIKTWVYVMQDRIRGPYKIGRSDNPLFREKTLQAEIPVIEVIEAWYTDADDEKRLHKMFQGYRLRGEWFYLTLEQIQAIREFFIDKPRLLQSGTLAADLAREKAEHVHEMDLLHEAIPAEEISYNADAVDFMLEGFGLEI